MVSGRCIACRSKIEVCLLPDSHRAQLKHVWCVDFLLGGKHGKRIRKQMKSGVSKKDAEKFEHMTIADFERGLYIPQDKSKTSLADVLDKYFNEHAAEQNRNQIAARHYVRVFKELLGNMPVGNITLSHLEEARSQYKEKTGRTNASLNRAFAILKAALNHAVVRGYLRQNPAQHLKRLPVKETIPRFLSVEEINRLRACIKDKRLDDYVVVLLHTGIRPIDIKELSWGQVDMQNRVIQVTTHKGRKGHTYTVPIDGELQRVVERRFKETKGVGPVFDVSNLRKLTEEAIIESKINENKAEPFTIYGLKHCYASHLLMNGASIFDVAKLLGHTDTAMVVKHYGHLTNEHLRSVQAKINLTPPMQQKFEVI